MALVQLVVRGLEYLAGREIPAGIRRRDAHGVAGVDLEHRHKVAREVSVQGAALERDDVQRHAASRLRAASATRATDGMYESSICQYGYGTSKPVTRRTGPRRS